MSLYVVFDGGSGSGKGTIIKAFQMFLHSRGHYSCAVLRDNELDPLRDIGKNMLPWCERHGIDRNTFLLPLFAAGGALANAQIDFDCGIDFILRDRSFVSSLGYTPASSYSQEQIWDMYVNHMKVRVPDLAVIVDADVNIAMEREAKRKQIDKGLGGKMSGDRENRERIRNSFLQIKEAFLGRLNVLVISNNGPWTTDAEVIEGRARASVEEIVAHLKQERGVDL
ncbi:MAG: hypothetical protein HYT93_04960 [Parcubacteria group bacterium]|nr:hypothetical protein [Parcubacteria group bacterium]